MHPKRTTAHRWWQEYVLTRALEHDIDGRLVWRTVVLSTPRQMGKSWLLRELCMWRLAQAERLGEVQTVVHAASKLSQAYGVWRPAAFWARHNGYQVRLANGEQSITAPDGSQWLIQAANDDLGVSLSVGLGVVDEAWNVQREVFENGLEPTAAEAADAQMWLISTAGRKSAGDPAAASDLMPTYRDHGLRSLDAPGSLLFLEWSAPQGADIDSPDVWRSATPHWTEERLELVGGHRAKATSAEAQEAFAMQWLNQWPDQTAADRWLPGFGSQRFEGEVVWGCAAVEAAYGFPPVVALAGWAGDGRLVVSAKQCATVPEAAMAVFDAGDVPVRVGKSLLHDPVWQPFDPEAMVGTAAKSAMEFRTLVDEGVLWHDGSEVLAEQVRDCDIVYGPDGPRVASRSSRLDAIKAVTWAAVGLRNAPEVARVF
jgi:hypothetical protein